MQQPLNDYLDKVINSKFNDTQQESMFADEQPSRETLLRESGMKASRSAIKSVEANIKRGKRAMNTAITERRTVHRAMFNHELGGWVDFEWGDDGLTKPFNKKGEPVGKGIAHIIEARQRKDGMSYQDVVRMLTNNVVETIAKGEVAGHWVRNEGKSESIQLDYNGYRAGLIKNKGSNAWLLTAFELYPTDANSAGSVDTERATQSKPTLTRQGMGAVGGQNVRSNDQDVNSSPDIEQARTIIERNLGKEFAERIEFMRSSDFPSDDGRAKSEGFFIDGKIHLVVDNIDATDVMNRAERMVWVAWHEFAHNGVDVKYGNQYDRVMAHARSNPLIKRLSQIKQAEYRNEGLEINENVATEESLAEIYAAIKTGNWAEIESRYSLKVGDVWKKGSSKGKLETLLEQVVRVFRNIASKITGKDLRKASTGDVLAILRKVDNAVNDVVSGETQTENNGENEPKFSIYSDDADKVMRAADRMGLYAYRDTSRVSNSEYVEVWESEQAYYDGEESIKIRVSDHALPSHYTQADFDIAPKRNQERNNAHYADGSWTDAMQFIAKKFNKPLPKYVQNLVDKKNSVTQTAPRAKVNKPRDTKEMRSLKERIAENQQMIERLQVQLENTIDGKDQEAIKSSIDVFQQANSRIKNKLDELVKQRDTSQAKFSLAKNDFAEQAKPRRNANSFDEARAIVEKLVDKPLTNKNTGMVATISKRTLEKMVSGKATKQSSSVHDHLMAVANVGQLFENAIFDSIEQHKTNDVNIAGIHRLYAPLLIDKKVRLVKLTVKAMNFNQGNRVYTVETIEVENGTLGNLKARNDENQITFPQSADVQSLIQQISDFNSKSDDQAENATRYSTRPNKKQSALEMMTSEKVNQNPDLLDRLSDGGYKQLKSNLKKEFDKGVAYIDEKVHDRLRPVVDWIKGFDIQGLSDLDKKRIVDTIYAAEGVKASD